MDNKNDNNTVPGPMIEAKRFGIERNPIPNVRNPLKGNSNININNTFNTLWF